MTRWPLLLLWSLMALLFALLLFGTDRADFGQLIGLWGLLSGGYLLLLRQLGLSLRPGRQLAAAPGAREDATVARWIGWAGLGWRAMALWALPPWSDDYFRFIWDGRLWTHGINPFAALPVDYMADPTRAAALGLTPEVFAGLNSPSYHTIYPPLLQGIFWLAATLSPTSIVGAVWVMKAFVLAAEAGTLWLLRDLLRPGGKPQRWLAFYALHPLVVMELCGNLHFEALMITALLGAIWLLNRLGAKGWWASALSLGLGVVAKLLPLMLLPLMLRRLGWGRSLAYGSVVLLLTGLLFLPIFDLPTLRNLFQSVDLYFHRFEFNASVHYLVRWVGYQLYGRNLIRTFGTWLALASVGVMLLYTFMERRPRLATLPLGMLWFFAIYFAGSPIVHPWYGTTLVALACLTRWRWPMVWSLLLPLSYATYRTPAYLEDYRLTALIYLGALAWGLGELWLLQRKQVVVGDC
jgi:hypothetical protein